MTRPPIIDAVLSGKVRGGALGHEEVRAIVEWACAVETDRDVVREAARRYLTRLTGVPEDGAAKERALLTAVYDSLRLSGVQVHDDDGETP